MAALLVLGLPSHAAAAHVDLHPPLPYPVIRAGQEAEIESLLAPWQEGHAVTGSWQWTGTQVEREQICFVLDHMRGQDARACLVTTERREAIAGSRPSRELTGAVSIYWHGPSGEDADAALDAVTRQLQARLPAGDPRTLWSGTDRLGATPEVREAQDILGVLGYWLMVLHTTAALGLALLWMLRAAVREARSLPGGGLLWVALLALLSLLPRWWLAVDAPMTAWSWTRNTAVRLLLKDDPLWPMLLGPEGVWLDGAESLGITAMAAATPIALFCHASRLFSDARVAWVAAALLALSPHHIRFSAGPTQFVPSLLTSSLAFYWLYLTLAADKPWERAVRLSLLPAWLWMALTMRPLNILFAPLMLLAVAIAAQPSARAWRWTVAAVVVASAAAVVGLHWAAFGDGASSTGPLHVVEGALSLLLRADWNPLTYWALTPPVWPVLIVVGVWTMWQRPWPALARPVARARAVWLLVWLLGFIAAHGVVVVDEPMNNARYQLHSVPAMAMLAAAGWIGLWTQVGTRKWAWAAAIPALAAPWLHRDAIGDVGFDVMRERAFLHALRDDAQQRVPPGCTVIELMRDREGTLTSRIDRVTTRLGATGDQPPHWRRLTLQPEPAQGEASATRRTTSEPTDSDGEGAIASAPLVLLPDAATRVAAVAGCLAFYQGPECAMGPRDRRMHPACAAVLAAAPWEPVAEQTFAARVYDHGVSWHLHRHGDAVILRMWRRSGDPGKP